MCFSGEGVVEVLLTQVDANDTEGDEDADYFEPPTFDLVEYGSPSRLSR